MKKPYVDASLLEYLTKLFPDTCPDIDAPERSIWAQVGAQMVIKHLKSLHEHQLKDSMK